MALTNAERQRRYRERQILNNKEEYDKKISLKMKKHYKKLKNEDIEENEEEKEEIITPLKAIKRRINPLNKSKLSENTIKIYLRSIRKIYKNYNKKEIEDDSEIIKLLRNEPYNLEKITLQLEFVKTDLINVIKENYKDIRNLRNK
jgi:hypothetical protein